VTGTGVTRTTTEIRGYLLRVGDLRALYNVDEGEVVVLLIGRKVGNKLIVEGEEFYGHQDHPTEPSGNGPEEDPE
jgi:hypothetical protein